MMLLTIDITTLKQKDESENALERKNHWVQISSKIIDKYGGVRQDQTLKRFVWRLYLEEVYV